MHDPRPGIYRHYKGNLYQVLEVAMHSETREKLVVYRPLYGERALWVRPLSMFVEEVVVDGVRVPRFAWQYAAAPDPLLEPSSKVASVVTSGAAALASTGQRGASDGSRPPVSTAPDRALPRDSETSPPALPGSLDERVRQAMSSADDKPDFSSVPLFDHPATAIKVGAAIVAAVLMLVWIL